jgi:hypothetical protein
VLAGFLWVLQLRPGIAAAMLVTAVAIKATAGMYLPFAFIGSNDRKRFALFAAGAVVAVAVLGLIVFGGGAGAIASQVVLQQKLVATGSIPMQLSLLLGYDHLVATIRAVAFIILMTVFISQLVRAQRTGEWISGAGWTALTLVLTTAWLCPWYILWVLPIAAVAKSKRLLIAAGTTSAYLVLAYTVLPFVVHSQR